MKKKFLASLAMGLFMFGLVGMADATYIETVELYEYSIGETIQYTHTYDFSELTPIDFVSLAIVADDVDLGEIDDVYLNGTLLGSLTQLTYYTNWDYVLGPGPDDQLTTTVFNIDKSLLDWSLPISISIASNWGVEIETSTLTVQGSAPVPEPATIVLLGSGLLGLGVRARKKFKK